MDIVRRSPAALTLRIIFFELTIELSYLIVSAVLIQSEDIMGSWYGIVRVIISLLFMAIAISAVVILVSQWANEGYYLRPNELTVRRGIVNKTETSYPYANMKSVSVQQSAIGRLLNFGDIRILIPTLGREIIFTEISNPQKFAETLKEHIPYPENSQYLIRR